MLKSRTFWIGVAVGTAFGGVVLNKVAPGLKAKLPS